MEDTKTTPKAKTNNPEKKKKIISFSVLAVGLIALVVGVVFLVLNIIKMNQAADGDFLVTAGNWVMEGSDSKVVWDFTEIGKGSLTTNGHINDYNFIWSLKDGKLQIETDWLYDLENEYEYNSKEIRINLLGNKHNHITTTYYLILKE